MNKIKKRVLVLGSAGMLGHVVYLYLKRNTSYTIVGISRSIKVDDDIIVLDVTDKEKLKNQILDFKPDFIINCIGALIKSSNADILNAIYINSLLPHFLSLIAMEQNIKLIHISTDCVFSGFKGKYIETDEKDGKDVYARTKALGELENERDLTLRTSIIGPELKNGEGLLNWFLHQNGDVKGYINAIWSGVTTLELAKVIENTLEQNISGIYHVTNGIPINKFELLNLFRIYFGKNETKIILFENEKIDKSIIDTRNQLKLKIPNYNVMLSEMMDFMRSNNKLYSYKIN